jgi:hypothetical protein
MRWRVADPSRLALAYLVGRAQVGDIAGGYRHNGCSGIDAKSALVIDIYCTTGDFAISG